MAEFMFLFRNPPQQPLSPTELQQHMQKWLAWMDECKKKGVFKDGRPLDRKPGKILDGRTVVTDAPFAETKDIGGYWLVEARDLGHATEIARGCPGLDWNGVVEVRAVVPIDERGVPKFDAH